MATEIHDVEVMPAERTDEHAERFVNFHTAGQQHASAAVYCAAAAGAVAAQKKRSCQHGAFMPWVKALALPDGRTVGVRTVQRYMALAAEMAERIRALPVSERVNFLPASQIRHGVSHLPDQENEHSVSVLAREDLPATSVMELLASFDPTKTHELTNSAIARAVGQIAGEDTLSQLYFDWGIVRERKTGYQKYHPRKNLTDEEVHQVKCDAARKSWMGVRDALERHGLKECTWGLLSDPEKEAVVGLLDDVSKTIKKALRERRK